MRNHSRASKGNLAVTLAAAMAMAVVSGSAHAGTVAAFAGGCGIAGTPLVTSTGGAVTNGQREVPGGWFGPNNTCETFARAGQGSVGTSIRATAANGGLDGRGAGGTVEGSWRTRVTIRPIDPAASPPGSSVPVGLRADLSYDYRAARSAIAGAPLGVTGGDFFVGFSALVGFLGVGWVLRDEVTITLDRGLVRGPSNATLFGPEGFRVVSIPYFGQNVSGPFWDVPIGVPFEYGMVLRMVGGATAFAGEVVGESNASNSLKLPLGDVFLLPAGFTADSEDGTILNNRWMFAPVVAPPAGVPEPGTLGLLALGLLGGFAAARRRGRH